MVWLSICIRPCTWYILRRFIVIVVGIISECCHSLHKASDPDLPHGLAALFLILPVDRFHSVSVPVCVLIQALFLKALEARTLLPHRAERLCSGSHACRIAALTTFGKRLHEQNRRELQDVTSVDAVPRDYFAPWSHARKKLENFRNFIGQIDEHLNSRWKEGERLPFLDVEVIRSNGSLKNKLFRNSLRRMATFIDNVDYGAGEMSENVPSPRSDAGDYGAYYDRGLRTRSVLLKSP
ncbi:unnamed protein product [Protopolystoma xenopodis]|uniref:Uncharacterized protein n=1 Tax=Protopolystoma xenopodis TaxID=117903 RepID=A0A3S5CB08_9PLAT|nr:unnamed protein product [Protopolystoma xenopodis]